MARWIGSSLIVALTAAHLVACDTDDESTEMTLAPPSEAEAPAAEEAAPPEAETANGPTGVVNGEPFVARGALAHRIREDEPIEIRIFNRPVSCESFDADYRNTEGEPLISMFMHWPKAAGDTLAFGASEVHERFQFCRGRGGDRGSARCEPRDQEQGSLTVLEASPEGGALDFDVSSDNGSLSGRLDFRLCSRN